MSVFTARLYGSDYSVIDANLIELSLTQSLDSPADSLWARFICEKPPGEVTEAHVSLDGLPVFIGKLDRLMTSLSDKGIIAQIECRSSGALLLDNEALPHAYVNLDTDTIFARCAAQYGFTCVNPFGRRWLSLYTVRKGISEWEALCGFVQRAYSLTPYTQGNRIFISKPDPGDGFMLSNTNPGVRFTKMEYAFKPYEIISEVVVRDGNGYYSTTIQNPFANSNGIRRKRYSAPTSELAQTAASDAYSRIRDSMLAREKILVTTPTIIDSYPGRAAGVKSGSFERYGLMIGSQTYRMDESGCYTDLTLIRSEP